MSIWKRKMSQPDFYLSGAALVVLCMTGIGICDLARAQDPGPSAASRAAFEKCAKTAGLTLPDRKSGKPPTPPTDAQRDQIDQCLKDAGFDPPTGPPPGDCPRGDQSGGSQSDT